MVNQDFCYLLLFSFTLCVHFEYHVYGCLEKDTYKKVIFS
jgi:hypothetical protein